MTTLALQLPIPYQHNSSFFNRDRLRRLKDMSNQSTLSRNHFTSALDKSKSSRSSTAKKSGVSLLSNKRKLGKKTSTRKGEEEDGSDDDPLLSDDEVLVSSTQIDHVAKRFRVDRPPIDPNSQMPSEKNPKIVVDLMTESELSQEMNAVTKPSANPPKPVEHTQATVTGTASSIASDTQGIVATPQVPPAPESTPAAVEPPQSQLLPFSIPSSQLEPAATQQEEEVPAIRLLSVTLQQENGSIEGFWKEEIERHKKNILQSVTESFVMMQGCYDQRLKKTEEMQIRNQKECFFQLKKALEENDKLKEANAKLEESLKKHKAALAAFVNADL